MSSIISTIWEKLDEDIRQVALRKLGPLSHLVGNWKGNGYAIISRPDAQKDQLFNFQQNVTIEQIAFIPVLAPVLNRSATKNQPDINLKGLMYEQLILDASEPTNILHFETGQWLLVPATTNPANKASIVRQANILHGASFLAIGDVPSLEPAPDKPNIEKLDTTPTGSPIDQDPTYLDQINNAQLPTGIPIGSNKDASVFLTHQLNTQKVIDHVTFRVFGTAPGTESRDQDPRLLNMPFLDTHAQPRELAANFYVEQIEDATASTRSSMQLQYGQRVILNFLDVNWPHVSAGTLKRHGL
jgi:hypothetical protein